MKINKGIYIMLCLFVGGLGLHKFYAGKWFQGLLYVAFCWTGVPVVLALFDLLGAMFKRPNEYGEIRVQWGDNMEKIEFLTQQKERSRELFMKTGDRSHLLDMNYFDEKIRKEERKPTEQMANKEQEFQEVILNCFMVGVGLIIFYMIFISPLIHELMQ